MKAVGIILAGGNNNRMGELSKKRAIPAMPVGGSFRCIDFALSNMSNSHVQTVAVLTQYNARSLNEHLSSSKWWDFGRKQGGLYLFTPTVTAENSDWYRGTADAMYQNIDFLKRRHEPYVIISSVLAEFWEDVSNQDTERFSNRVLKQFFVLNYAPNGMWTYFVSVYFMQNKDDEGLLDDEKFYTFLQKIAGFIWTYAITNPGVNALRTPVYAEMVNIVNDKPVEFSKYKFDADIIRSMFDNFSFNNARPITKAMIAWWAYQNDKQPLLSLETTFEIEHIYARNRNEKENSLTDARNVESLGNKALLEKRINIRASDYRFADKKKYYEGFTNSKGQVKEGTGVMELLDLTATSTDFTEKDIIDRYKQMIDCFINYLQKNGLLK